MGKTFKDQKNYPRPKRNAEAPLSTKYLSYMRGEFLEEEQLNDDEFKFEPGDFCPHCGEPTDFERGFLQCGECGWIDVYPDEIVPEEAA